MRLLVYADLQATDGSEICHGRPDVLLQHYRVEKFFNDLVEIYEKYQCDGVVDLGDTTDDRSSIPINTLDVLCQGLAKLPGTPKTNAKLTGNHEQFLRNTSVSNWRLFAPYFTVYNGVSSKQLDDSTRVWYASYPEDYQELARTLALEADKYRTQRKILFGHFQVKGATIGNAKSNSGVPMEALAGFDLVLLGHVHAPQSLSDRAHYVGSPFQQDWGEAGENKRVAVVDTERLKIKWIPMTGYPEHRAVTLSEFQESIVTQNEDRYRVTLTSHEESEKFFAHPMFGRAVGVYSYDVPEEGEVDDTETRDWSFDGTLKRYIETVPPVGIELSEEELLESGRIIANHS